MLRTNVEDKDDATASNTDDEDHVVHPSTPMVTLNDEETHVCDNIEDAVGLHITQQAEEDNEGRVNVEDVVVTIILNVTDLPMLEKIPKVMKIMVPTMLEKIFKVMRILNNQKTLLKNH